MNNSLLVERQSAQSTPRLLLLVLSGQMGETITIGVRTTVSVINLKEGRVRLEVDGPEDVRRLRAELKEFLAAPVDDSKQ